MSRLRLPVLAPVLAIFVTALSACGGSDRSSEDPVQVLDSASFEGVESGSFDASLGVESRGKGRRGDLDFGLSGSFQGEGKALPLLAADATITGTVQGRYVQFVGGLTLLSDRGFADYQGVEYEIEPGNFEFAKSVFLPDLPGEAKGGGGLDACRETISGVQLSGLVDKPSNDGTVAVAGVDTTKVSGELDAAGVVDAMTKLAADPACRSQLEAIAPLPLNELREAADELPGVVKDARVDVYVDDDDVIRRLDVELTADPKGGGPERVVVDFGISLSKINEEQRITAPPRAKPLKPLFQKLGIDALAFVTLPGGGAVSRYLLGKVAADAFPLGL